MIIITNEEKITVLQEMIVLLQANKRYFKAEVSGAHFGLCHAFAHASRGIVDAIFSMLEAIPELLHYKPAINGDEAYWFDRYDFNARIRICESVILELEKTLI